MSWSTLTLEYQNKWLKNNWLTLRTWSHGVTDHLKSSLVTRITMERRWTCGLSRACSLSCWQLTWKPQLSRLLSSSQAHLISNNLARFSKCVAPLTRLSGLPSLTSPATCHSTPWKPKTLEKYSLVGESKVAKSSPKKPLSCLKQWCNWTQQRGLVWTKLWRLLLLTELILN